MHQWQTHKCHSIYYHPTSQPPSPLFMQTEAPLIEGYIPKNMHAKIHFMQGGKADTERKRLPEKS